MTTSADPNQPARTDDVGAFVCPACDRKHINANDIRERRCASCQWWTGKPELAWARPELFTAHGKLPPSPPY